MRRRVSIILVSVAFSACSDPAAPPPEAASIAISPQSTTLTAVGDTVRHSAVVRDTEGAVMEGITVTWSVAESAVATIDGQGLLTAVGPGTAMVRATASGSVVNGTAPITVTQSVATVQLSGVPDSLLIGGAATLSAASRDRNNNLIAGAAIAWTSSSNAIATVSAGGVVTAVGRGVATIRATAGGINAERQVTVRRANVTLTRDTALSGTVSARNLVIPAGITVTASAPITFDVERATIAGGVVANCRDIAVLSSGPVRVTGRVDNRCSDSTAVTRGGITIAASDTLVITNAVIETYGRLHLTNDTSLTASDFPSMVPAGGRTSLADTYELRRVAGLVGSRAAAGECLITGPIADALTPTTPTTFQGTAGLNREVRCNGKLVLDGAKLRGQDGSHGIGSVARSNVSAVAHGGSGGAGGPLLVEVVGDIVILGDTRFNTGAGGNGGDAYAVGEGPGGTVTRGADAEAVAGHGGPEGLVRVLATGTITGQVFTNYNGGGKGGPAHAEGAPGEYADATAPAQGGGNANATAGDGGSGVKPGAGGAAEALGGQGGHGSAAHPAGAAGGGMAAIGGAGGRALMPPAGLQDVGGPGGPALATKGNGGAGYGSCSPAVAGGAGGRGGDVSGRGGAGGPGAGVGAPGTLRASAGGNGGNGGPGLPPGAGGSAGADNATGAKVIETDALKPGLPGATCTPPAAVAITIDPSVITGTHTMGSSPCPQVFGTTTLTNTGTVPVNWSTSPPLGVTFSPTSGTLQPGQSVAVQVLFNCTRATSFTANGVIIANGGAAGNTNRQITINATVQ